MVIGKEFGPYVVDEEVGSGAMATVFRARHKESGENVAVKLLRPELLSDDSALGRFFREVSILKQFDHPNIVRYVGSGRYGKSPFYIMEYLQGETLDKTLYRRTRLPWEEVANLGIHLCAALRHAHEKGIFHRDLKPANLMMTNEGIIKLTDFGIAKDTSNISLTGANVTVGTASYMSPEQCRGRRDLSHKTDLYSLGIVFYELLTGKPPFTGTTPMDLFLQHANKTDYKRVHEVVKDVPIWLSGLVDEMMDKEPARRPHDAKAVAAALQVVKQKADTQRGAE
ncbi:MAG TPA: serine/threonine-protein kinase [Gemmataceae bacterium]|nr:serine/threonine-protein kinase [Gemmataceae bacterium]